MRLRVVAAGKKAGAVQRLAEQWAALMVVLFAVQVAVFAVRAAAMAVASRLDLKIHVNTLDEHMNTQHTTYQQRPEE